MRVKRLLCALMALCVCALGACRGADGSGDALAQLVFFDAGSADAILITTEHGAVLVDAGLKDDADALINALNAQGVYALDALILTHFDKDHVGGAAKMLERVPVKQVYEPEYERDSKHVDAYREALSAASIEPVMLHENASFTLDGARYDIDVANESMDGNYQENDLSLVVRLTVGDARTLLAGDAENPRIAELLDEGDLKSGLLKVPHHGRYEKLSPAFFAAVGAQHAVITSSPDELEDDETVRALRASGAQVWLTREGAVTVKTDGVCWTASQAR